jgi:hypothetical protein
MPRRGSRVETFRRRQLYAQGSRRAFGRRGPGFPGRRLSKDGVSAGPRKGQSIRVVEWATPTRTPCSEARRFAGRANHYRRFVEGCAGLAAPLTALGSPTARLAWGQDSEERASFDALKAALSSARVAHL